MSEKPQEDLLESIISKSIAQREEARAAAPEDAPAPPPEDQAPPPPPEDGKEAPSPNKRTAVYRYLLVLFGAAFILLLLAYFIQQRSSETAISDLRDSMNLSRAELMEEIDGLREENEQHKATIQELEEDKAQAEEERDTLEEENQTYSQMVESVLRDREKGQMLAWLERFVREKDYLMAAVGIESFNGWYDWNWKVPTIGGQAPLPGQQARYRELRQEVLDHSDYLLAERNPRATEENPMLWITLAEDEFGPGELAAAKKLWNILYYPTDRLNYAAHHVKDFYQNEEMMNTLKNGAFRPSTLELLEQIKKDLILRGSLEEDEDGKVTATVDSDSTGTGMDTLHGESGGEQADTLSLLTDELAALQEEYAKLEEALQSSESTGEELKSRHDILTAFAILEQALRDKNYETAVKYVQILAQENPDLGIMNQDGTAYFDNHARLAEIITLLEKQGVLEPGEITISR